METIRIDCSVHWHTHRVSIAVNASPSRNGACETTESRLHTVSQLNTQYRQASQCNERSKCLQGPQHFHKPKTAVRCRCLGPGKVLI